MQRRNAAIKSSSWRDAASNLHPGYAAAQRMYVLRGYVPDAMPLTYGGGFVREGQEVILDDELILHLTRKIEPK